MGSVVSAGLSTTGQFHTSNDVLVADTRVLKEVVNFYSFNGYFDNESALTEGGFLSPSMGRFLLVCPCF